MIRGLVFCGIVLLASASQAATVKFSGTYGLLAGSDNLGIVGQQFLATIQTDGGANILSGQIWFNPPTVNHTLKYVLSGGTVALGGGTYDIQRDQCRRRNIVLPTESAGCGLFPVRFSGIVWCWRKFCLVNWNRRRNN